MKTIHLFILFVVVALVQIYVPYTMIFNQQKTIDNGKAYKFKTQPIDPNDPFRGKYVTLNFELNSALTKDTTFLRYEPVYVYIKEDSLGYAQVDTIAKEKLNSSSDYLLTKATYVNHSRYNDSLYEIGFNLPFNRFYMEESKAYDAELAVRQRRNDSIVNNVYGLVYLKDGDCVLDNVFIDDIPLKEYVEQHYKE